MELLIGIIGGGVISWLLTHWYYRKSSKEAPEWARSLIDRLPDKPPTIDELIDLYHEAVMGGAIVPHPSGFVKCPECGAGTERFEPWQVASHELDSIFHGYKCSECNYELTNEQD